MTARGTRAIERYPGDQARARLPAPVAEPVMFVLKQGWAALFGILLPAWVYARHGAWQMVGFSKMGSWYLLLYVAFATVTLVVRDMCLPAPLRLRPGEGLASDANREAPL